MLKTEPYKIIEQQLRRAVDPCRLKIREPLSLHTTFRIGGPADYLVLPASPQEVAAVLGIARKCSLPVTILGNGSNVLVLDKGVRGVVIKIGEDMAALERSGTGIRAGAGALLADVSRFAADAQLTGLEFAVGIPGSIGGAVFMNAGAYEGEMCNVVEGATGVCTDGSIKHFSKEEIDFSYRHSIFQDNHCIICEVELSLQPGEPHVIARKMVDLTDRRESKQPLEMPSAGSTFKRPPGYFAGTLIEETGLKGLRLGGAQVSEKHAGFVVNAGGATASDVLRLIREIQRRVYEKFRVMLHPEVRIIGEE